MIPYPHKHNIAHQCVLRNFQHNNDLFVPNLSILPPLHPTQCFSTATTADQEEGDGHPLSPPSPRHHHRGNTHSHAHFFKYPNRVYRYALLTHVRTHFADCSIFQDIFENITCMNACFQIVHVNATLIIEFRSGVGCSGKIKLVRVTHSRTHTHTHSLTHSPTHPFTLTHRQNDRIQQPHRTVQNSIR